MNKFLSGVLAVVMSLGMATVAFDAEAKRVGGGKSTGMQRQATPQKAPDNTATPAQTPNAAPAAAGAAGAAGAAAKKSSWMGPLAGLAAGLGLAALASYLGFGEEFATMMMIMLAVMVVLAIVGFMMRKRAAQQAGMAYAGAAAGAGGGGFNAPVSQDTLTQRQSVGQQGGSMIGAGIGANAGDHSTGASVGKGHIPADFDVAGFVRNAKVNYIRLQAANDAGNLDDIRAFTTPEMFAEIKMDIVERAGKAQTTEVVQLDADVIDVAEETALYIVSVRFTGTVREDGEAVQVDEIWHLSKPRNGATGWLIAGIQQVQ
jgi:predicted lipid-binding transport protein (Tim44 family)